MTDKPAIKITVLAFEEPYSDGSGIEYGVQYDSKERGGLGEIEITHVESIWWPVEKLDWLIDALRRIRAELNEASKP